VGTPFSLVAPNIRGLC